MIREALILLVSVAVAATPMAGVMHAFELRARFPDTPSYGTRWSPPVFHTYAARTGELPCPAECRVPWPARPHPGAREPKVRAPEGTAWSPAYCVRIGASGRALSVRLIAGSGNAAIDRRLARELRDMPFTPAGWHDPMTAWHRVLVMLPDRPIGYDGRPHHGPEADFHFVG